MKGMSFKGSAFKSTYGGTSKGIMPDESIQDYRDRKRNERLLEGLRKKGKDYTYGDISKARKEGRIVSGSYEPKQKARKRTIQKTVRVEPKAIESDFGKRDKVLSRRPRAREEAILLDAKTARSVTKPSRNRIQRRKARPRVSLDLNLMDRLNLRKGQGKATRTRTKTRFAKKRTPKTGGKTGKVFVNLKEMNLLNKMSGSNS